MHYRVKDEGIFFFPFNHKGRGPNSTMHMQMCLAMPAAQNHRVTLLSFTLHWPGEAGLDRVRGPWHLHDDRATRLKACLELMTRVATQNTNTHNYARNEEFSLTFKGLISDSLLNLNRKANWQPSNSR